MQAWSDGDGRGEHRKVHEVRTADKLDWRIGSMMEQPALLDKF